MNQDINIHTQIVDEFQKEVLENDEDPSSTAN